MSNYLMTRNCNICSYETGSKKNPDTKYKETRMSRNVIIYFGIRIINSQKKKKLTATYFLQCKADNFSHRKISVLEALFLEIQVH